MNKAPLERVRRWALHVVGDSGGWDAPLAGGGEERLEAEAQLTEKWPFVWRGEGLEPVLEPGKGL